MEYAFIKDEKAQKYIKCFKHCAPKNLQEIYPATEKAGLDLLMKMIAFDPDQRISAEQAIKSNYFDDIRLEEQEEFEPIVIDLSFIDKYHEG